MMGLDALIDSVVAPSGRGRRASEVQATTRRELTKADVDVLWKLPEGGLGSTTPPLQRIRFQHHQLARLLAQGTPQVEAAMITGMDQSRISVLKNDPTFKELLDHYSSQVKEIFINVHERLAAVGLSSIDELQARLEETPDDFSLRELMELAALTLDRGGFGPSSKINHQHQHLNITPDALAQIKGEVGRRQNGTIRSLQPPSGAGAEVGSDLSHGSLGQAQTIEGSASERDHVPAQSGAGTEEKVSG